MSTATATATAPTLTVVDARVICQECGFKSHSLIDHLQTDHGMTVADYHAAHPGAATVSQAALDAMAAKRKGTRREAIPAIVDLTVNLIGITERVNHHVPEDECLPLPEGYVLPTKGKAKAAFRDVLECLHFGDTVYLWGPPGTGKDAVLHAYSAWTRTPAILHTFTPGTDVKRWLYSREITSEGTSWSYGALWEALVHGVEGRDGKRHPALIVFSDVDRATPDQLEEFRLMLDTTAKRVSGPTGRAFPIMPGTKFAFTANSCGSGDDTGRLSSRAMDSSLLDRMGAFVEATYMDWSEESEILRAKFPQVNEVAPKVFDELGLAVANLRKAMDGSHDEYDLEGELTHRGICEILKACNRKVALNNGKAPNNLLKLGFKVWLKRLDRDNQLIAKRLIDAVITGGAFDDEDAAEA